MAKYNWPLATITKTQEFGGNAAYYAKYGQKGHNGMDLRAAVGTPVYASRAGTINFEGWGQNNSWMGKVAGIAIIIDHGDVYTGYAHLSSTKVNKGQSVAQGQLIGYSGATGGVTSPHLHFEFIGKPINFNNGFAGRVNPSQFNVGVEPAAPAPQQGKNDMITRDVLGALYDDLLGRAPDQGAYDHYVGKYDTNFVVADLRASGEYRDRKANVANHLNNLNAELQNARNDRDAAKGQLQALIDGNVTDDATIEAQRVQLSEKDTKIDELNKKLAAAIPTNPGTTTPVTPSENADTSSLWEKLVKLLTDITDKLKEKK